MQILIAYFSRTGHTETLALALAKNLRSRGHTVTLERIITTQMRSKWRLTWPLLSTLPVLPLYLTNRRFRTWWLQRYQQAEVDIAPLAHANVSGFERICVGGPKWLYLSYPLARYLKQVRGLETREVGAFATFCGPPLEVFEREMLFVPLQQRLALRGARVVATLAVSSQFHEFFWFGEMQWLFRLISWLAFRRPLASFALDSVWGQQQLENFCAALCAPVTGAVTSVRVADRAAP